MYQNADVGAEKTPGRGEELLSRRREYRLCPEEALRHLEQLRLREGGGEELDSDRHAGGGVVPGGNADAAVAGEVQGDGEDVREVHLQRIGFLAELERGASSTSHCRNASSKSRRISVRTFWARR